MQYFYLLKKYPIPIALGLIFILGLFIYSAKNLSLIEDIYLSKGENKPAISLDGDLDHGPIILDQDQSGEDQPEQESDNDQILDPPEEVLIVIDIAGEVVNPNVYLLPEGTRIFQAIEAAGGLSTKADTSEVNLAAILYDGTKLCIPKKNEKVTIVQTSGGPGPSSNPAGPSQPTLININTADSKELQKLTGVGPATAEKILAYRKDYGQFNKIEDLMNVSGIGEKTFAKFKDKISVN